MIECTFKIYWYSKYASFAAQTKFFMMKQQMRRKTIFKFLFLLTEQFSIPRALFRAIYEDVRDIFMAR